MSEDKKPFGSTKNISELKAPFYYVYMPQYIGDTPTLIRVNKKDDFFNASECLPTKRPFDLWGPIWAEEKGVFFQNYFLAWAHYQKILTHHQKLLSNQ